MNYGTTSPIRRNTKILMPVGQKNGGTFFGFKNKKQVIKEKSKTRARVEHIFGFMEQSMNGLV